MIDHSWETGAKSFEKPDESDEIIKDNLIKEYQLKMDKALQEGNTEKGLYYSSKIERIREKSLDQTGSAKEIGSVPFPELKNAFSKLQDYKRELSSLEHQRKPGKEDPELERKISRAKQKVKEQEGEYKRLQQQRKNQLLMPYGEILGLKEKTSVAGNPEKDSENWHKQGENYSCAVVCQEFIAEQLLNQDFSEQELIEYAKKRGWYDPESGTTPMDVGKILESMGLIVEKTNGQTLQDLVSGLNSEKKIICSVNNLILARPEFFLLPGQQANHAVEVIGIKKTDSDTWVILNDPGVENGRGLQVKASTFLKAWSTGKNFTVYASNRGEKV